MIKLQILEYSYWEHFKALKDISLILPITHPKRILLDNEVNKLQKEIHDLKGAAGKNYTNGY
jgi:hypothetical protein